jgi:YVTN family beta-propeller protein
MPRMLRLVLTAAALTIAVVLFGTVHPVADNLGITTANWGAVTSPVFGTLQSGIYGGAEMFAGPFQFDNNYFHGVLPNGRMVRPAGVSVQIGMNPLGARLTPDGNFLITSNDDERDPGLTSLKNSGNRGGYSLSVLDTHSLQVVSQIDNVGRFFVGLQVTGDGPYFVWASGGADHDVKLFNVSRGGFITVANPSRIPIPPIQPANVGYVSNYTPAAALNPPTNAPAVPTGFSRSGQTRITFPAGMALSPDHHYLYVACDGDNSMAVIDTVTQRVVNQVPAGYFPYDVAVSADGSQIAVSNWGITEYKFTKPTYDGLGLLTAIDPPNTSNGPEGYFVPRTSTTGTNPQTSSVTIFGAPGADGTRATRARTVHVGRTLDMLTNVGDTHPSALAIVAREGSQVLYVAQANSDSLALIDLNDSAAPVRTVDLSLVSVGGSAYPVHGTYPNGLALTPDRSLLFVAEAGINSVAVLDTSSPLSPRLLGRILTGWYPTALEVSPDGRALYIVNAKGIGEDVGPGGGTRPVSTAPSLANIDSNYIFGTVQKVDITRPPTTSDDVLTTNLTVNTRVDTSVVPLGGQPSPLIKRVFFIVHENKTFDSMLGDQSRYAPFASTQFLNGASSWFNDPQYTSVAVNTQSLANRFAVAANYYSDAEESDAGHQFAASGTATDYTEKTLLVKAGRGLLVNKNFEPEDYPEAGYIFNNAARNGVSLKDYGALIRIAGTDTGTSSPTIVNDPASGNNGYPAASVPLSNIGDVASATRGFGQSYFLSLPILAVLGSSNASGEPRIDPDYPGYNFNISDQRRALEFIKDFDRMAAANRLPQLVYIYQPNDHTGGAQARNVDPPTGAQQVADGDVALGMVVRHIMASQAYYNSSTGEGAAIFITYDDAQSTLDHIHPHRTPLIVVSPYAKPGYMGTKHYSTASVVKTEELLLGLPPSNLGDLFATDLRDLFQPTYNGIAAADVPVTRTVSYQPSPEGRKIWALVSKLDTSSPDKDSRRLGAVGRLSMAADRLRAEATRTHTVGTRRYRAMQKALFKQALAVTKLGKRDDD